MLGIATTLHPPLGARLVIARQELGIWGQSSAALRTAGLSPTVMSTTGTYPRSAGGVPTVGERNKGPSQSVVVRCFGGRHIWGSRATGIEPAISTPWVKGLVRDFSAKRDRADVDTVIKDMPAFRGGAGIAAVADLGHDHHFRLACYSRLTPPSSSRPKHTPEVSDRQTMKGAFMRESSCHRTRPTIRNRLGRRGRFPLV